MTDRDFDALLAEVRDRSDVTSSGCWLWKGALSDLGYARALRPVVLVHRAVAWGNAGFPGDSLIGFPAVHHRCARKSCVNPSHLTPVTALVNHLEAQTRKAFREYQEALKEALRELEPNHRLLRMAYLYELDGVSQIGTTSAEMESLGARLRRHAKNTAREIRARELEIERFAQVLEAKLSTTLENEAIATLENEATQTDWMGDLSGRLGIDSAAGRGRRSATSGRS